MSLSDISHLFNQPGTDPFWSSDFQVRRGASDKTLELCWVHSELFAFECGNANDNPDFKMFYMRKCWAANIKEI